MRICVGSAKIMVRSLIRFPALLQGAPIGLLGHFIGKGGLGGGEEPDILGEPPHRQALGAPVLHQLLGLHQKRDVGAGGSGQAVVERSPRRQHLL